MATELLPKPTSKKPYRDPFFYGWRFLRHIREDGTQNEERVPLTEWDVLHPQEDDFIVQNDVHNNICIYLKNVLLWRCRDRSNVLVLQDHRIDWQITDLEPHGPDLVLFLDAPRWDGRKGTFHVRDEGARPIFVIEVTSPSTRSIDWNEKAFDYCRAGIPLYVIVDPYAGEEGPEIHLTAYHPSADGPVLVKSRDSRRVWLPEVNLWLAVQGDQVFCLEPDGRPLVDYSELAERAEHEKARAESAEAKIKELEAELRRLRGE